MSSGSVVGGQLSVVSCQWSVELGNERTYNLLCGYSNLQLTTDH